jgi:hypothetical protein
MRKSFVLNLLLALSLIGLSGCAQSQTSPSLKATQAQTLAAAGTAIVALTSPDTPIFEVSAADTSTSTGSTSGPGPCVFDDTTGQFSCPDMSRDGITLTRTFTIRDAAGNVQSKFDATTTASVEVQTSASGTTSRPHGATVTINRTGDITTSGLAGAETTHALNGTEQGTIVAVSTASDGTQVTDSTTVSDATQNLVVPVPANGTQPRADAGRFPLSGSRSHSTTTTTTRGSDTKTNSTSRTETFDGTSVVQVVLTVNGQTQNCTVDLSSHTNTCGK